MKDLKRVLVAGEGGQGVQVIAKVLTKSAYYSNKKVAYIANYGVEQRGGVSLGFVQISNQEIGFPKFQNADIVVVLTDRSVPRVMEYIQKNTVIVYDDGLVSDKTLADIHNKKISLSALNIAKETMIGKVFNVIVLGALAKIVGEISIENVQKSLDEELAHNYKKRPELKHFNERALEIGMQGQATVEAVHA